MITAIVHFFLLRLFILSFLSSRYRAEEMETNMSGFHCPTMVEYKPVELLLCRITRETIVR